MTAGRHSSGHADPTEQRDQQRPVHLSQLTETVPHAAAEQRRPDWVRRDAGAVAWSVNHGPRARPAIATPPLMCQATGRRRVGVVRLLSSARGGLRTWRHGLRTVGVRLGRRPASGCRSVS